MAASRGVGGESVCEQVHFESGAIRAKANLAVRESTASFFYHPFLGVQELEETVNGIEDLGYTFVSATDLK